MAKVHDIAICPAGSVIAYDTRILHRGEPNQTPNADQCQFSHNWYCDTLNP